MQYIFGENFNLSYSPKCTIVVVDLMLNVYKHKRFINALFYRSIVVFVICKF